MADADPQRDLRTTTASEVAAPAPLAVEPAAKRAWLRPLLLVSVPLLIVLIGGYVWLISGRFVSTDNAYVQQDKVSVSSDVAGRIVAVNARENQPVQGRRRAVPDRSRPVPHRRRAGRRRHRHCPGAGDLAPGRLCRHQRRHPGRARRDRQCAGGLPAPGTADEPGLHHPRPAAAVAACAGTGPRPARQCAGSATQAKAKLATGAAVPGITPAIAAAQVQRQKAALDLARTTVRAPTSGTISQSDRLQVGQMMITACPRSALSPAIAPGWRRTSKKPSSTRCASASLPRSRSTPTPA